LAVRYSHLLPAFGTAHAHAVTCGTVPVSTAPPYLRTHTFAAFFCRLLSPTTTTTHTCTCHATDAPYLSAFQFRSPWTRYHPSTLVTLPLAPHPHPPLQRAGPRAGGATPPHLHIRAPALHPFPHRAHTTGYLLTRPQFPTTWRTRGPPPATYPTTCGCHYNTLLAILLLFITRLNALHTAAAHRRPARTVHYLCAIPACRTGYASYCRTHGTTQVHTPPTFSPYTDYTYHTRARFGRTFLQDAARCLARALRSTHLFPTWRVNILLGSGTPARNTHTHTLPTARALRRVIPRTPMTLPHYWCRLTHA